MTKKPTFGGRFAIVLDEGAVLSCGYARGLWIAIDRSGVAPIDQLSAPLLEMQQQVVEAKKALAVAIADEKKLQKQYTAATDESIATQFQQQWIQQKQAVERLKDAFRILINKIEEAKRKKNLLIAGKKRTEAEQQIWPFDRRTPPSGAEVVELPTPSSGYGGSELVVSPNQEIAAMFVYSGQSEVGWELFALTPTLRHIGRLPYVHGHATVPVWSPDSRWLAMLVSTGQTVRGTDQYFEEVSDPDVDEEVDVEWAQILIQDVADVVEHAEMRAETDEDSDDDEPDPIDAITVATPIPRSTDFEALREWETYEALSFAAADRIVVKLPWGGTHAESMPLPPAITTEPPPPTTN